MNDLPQYLTRYQVAEELGIPHHMVYKGYNSPSEGTPEPTHVTEGYYGVRMPHWHRSQLGEWNAWYTRKQLRKLVRA